MVCLIPCVVSVWAPGSPFDVTALANSTIHDPFTSRNSSVISDVEADHIDPILYTSVILLMAGITAARFGKCYPSICENQCSCYLSGKAYGSLI